MQLRDNFLSKKAAVAPAEGQKELAAEEKAEVRAGKEVKKAEKARRRDEAKLMKGNLATAAVTEDKPMAFGGKVEKPLYKAKPGGGAENKEGEDEKKATIKAERRAKQQEQRKEKAAGKGKRGFRTKRRLVKRRPLQKC